jgi:Undecaprenyl-phosphate glucose phosphotransferase
MDDSRFSILEEDFNDRVKSRSPKENRITIASFQMAVDGAMLIILSYASLSMTMHLTNHDPNRIEYLSYFFPTIGVTLLTVFTLARSGIYDPINELDILRLLGCTIKRLSHVIFMFIVCLFILKISDNFSRLWLAIWTLSSAVALCGSRLIAVRAAERLTRAGRLTKNIAVVGANETGQQLATMLGNEGSGMQLVGLFDERKSRIARVYGRGKSVSHLSALEELLRNGYVDEIIIAVPPSASRRIFELMRFFHPFPVSLRVLSPTGFEDFQVLDSRRYGDIGTFCVMGKPLDEAAIILKRVEDILISLICLLITLPLFALIAISIKLDTRGPFFFKQKRLGANNIPFDLLKFRSMHVDQSDPLGCQLTEAGDPRITRIGRFIRRTSLDELPQLINVLRGDMSLVGPRPHALAASAAGVAYARAIQDYPIRHRVKPGITGWAQVNGWRGETVTIEQIRCRVEHDLYYIENWSLAFDFLILGWTVFTVLSRENAV